MRFLIVKKYHLATYKNNFIVPFQNSMATSGAWATVKPTKRPMYPPAKIISYEDEADKRIFEIHESNFSSRCC